MWQRICRGSQALPLWPLRPLRPWTNPSRGSGDLFWAVVASLSPPRPYRPLAALGCLSESGLRRGEGQRRVGEAVGSHGTSMIGASVARRSRISLMNLILIVLILLVLLGGGGGYYYGGPAVGGGLGGLLLLVLIVWLFFGRRN